jgi:hypothetical protein
MQVGVTIYMSMRICCYSEQCFNFVRFQVLTAEYEGYACNAM